MNEGVIATRYARSLLEYASERGVESYLYDRMKTLAECFTAVPRLKEALENPMISDKDKTGLICQASGMQPTTEAGDDGAEAMRRFCGLVIRNRRDKYLHNMALCYQTLYRRLKNISLVRMTSASPMPPQALERIRSMVEKRNRGPVEFVDRTDNTLEGGFIFQIDDMRLDASVASQLRNIRKQFIQKNRKLI